MKTKNRDPSLDLLRASAVLMVIAYHVNQRWPVSRPWLLSITEMGSYGVDLFFVLSGWLIGGLYWKEKITHQNVEVGRFIARRSLRTVPPYLVALGVSWAGVWASRHEPFNWGYLVFIQNYYREIPYFLVSWSLCVEEQFYLLLPGFLLVAYRMTSKIHLLLLGLSLVPMCLRWSTVGSALSSPFGFYTTASHFRFEGLLLGVCASYVFYNDPDLWTKAKRFCSFAWLPSIIALAGIALLGSAAKHVLGYTIAAVAFTILLIHLIGRSAFWGQRIVYGIACCSYSLYLTHAFMLAIGLSLIQKTPNLPEVVHLGMMILCIGVPGWMFYNLVERPSLKLRDQLVTRRNSSVLTATHNG